MYLGEPVRLRIGGAVSSSKMAFLEQLALIRQGSAPWNQIFPEGIKRSPHNGTRMLFGLWESFKVQKKNEDASG
jgi:hypothetical protein